MRALVIALWIAAALLAQDHPPPFRLVREAAALKAYPEDQRDSAQFAAQLRAVHLALRDWIESRLPQTAASMGDLKDLEAALKAEAAEALGAPSDDSVPGYVQLEFRRLPELYDTLFVVAGASVDCGDDEAVYMYYFNAQGRTRVFEDRPGNNLWYTNAALELSEPDSQGQRLLVTHYVTTQCASTWMDTAYSAYRLSGRNDAAERLLSGHHSFWLGNDGPEFVLSPAGLTIEFLDASLDAGIHNRTQVHRYSFSGGVQRLDPVAFQPQDFVEEWLTRPWSEMQSRSAPGTAEEHERLYSDSPSAVMSADYQDVLPCAAEPDHWLIGLEFERIGEKTLEPPADVWFLVRDLGDFHYRMEFAGASRPPGCPGRGPYGPLNASDKHPWLSAAGLKALK